MYYCNVVSYLEAPASGIWAGWTDEPSEGTFVDMNDYNVTIQSVGVDLWRKSEPNGDLRENCVLLDGFDFVDMNCDKKFCGICDMGASPVFKLRGKNIFGICSTTGMIFFYPFILKVYVKIQYLTCTMDGREN